MEGNPMSFGRRTNSPTGLLRDAEGGEMAGAEDDEVFEKALASSCSFEWDDDSKLYFHASSGFYHDPNAGWYYSSRDGVYYTFENGSYKLLICDEGEESQAHQCTSSTSNELIEDNPYIAEHVASDGTENPCQLSDWLEETLIDLYLSGYSNSGATVDSSSLPTNGEDPSQVSYEGLVDHLASTKLPDCHHGITSQQVQGEWIPEDVQEAKESNERFSGKDALSDEENWQAQYGQAVQSDGENLPSFSIVDLWDWKMEETAKKNRQVARLVGRLIRRSSKLHPSVPAGGGLLKTAAICDVHLDLVRVASGKVYRLRSPSIEYLASLSAYDSSNPTKDWGFPDLCINMHNMASSFKTCVSNTTDMVISEKSSATLDQVPSTLDKHINHAYRDRAAERRILHGTFNIGPGQKNVLSNGFYEEGPSSQTYNPEEASAEAMHIAFGQGSYARRILEKMGWKDGEALGSTNKGILEPLQPVSNKGYAGLGWSHIHRGT